jgi:hypothetical protein
MIAEVPPEGASPRRHVGPLGTIRPRFALTAIPETPSFMDLTPHRSLLVGDDTGGLPCDPREHAQVSPQNSRPASQSPEQSTERTV